MTVEELVSEGRRLARPSVLLSPYGDGTPVAMWYDADDDELDETGERVWLTIDGSAVPGRSFKGFLTVITTEGSNRGRVELGESMPTRTGTRLFGRPASILSPITAVFARGSERVGEWLRSNGWERDWGYNSNFKDADVVKAYSQIQQAEHPFWNDSVPAMLGGWHLWDEDWARLADQQLIVQTFWDSEPWVEVWRSPAGEFKVIPRTT